MSSDGRIDILTRVEGHGRVELVRSGDRVTAARLHLYESPRLFEALLVGKRYDEVAEIACRICSICSTVHKVAALQATEQALGVKVSCQTVMLRELAVMGGQIASHGLHIFCLALPDYLGVGGFPGLATVYPRELQQGLRIKALGNLIQETIGGRAIHPFNLLIGGVGKVPSVDQLRQLAGQLEAIQGDVEAVIPLVAGLTETLPPLPPLPFCAVSGGPPLFGDHLATTCGTSVPADSASVWLNEQIEAPGHAKVSRFDDSKAFMVGPLARLNLSAATPYAERLTCAPPSSSLLARAIELQQAVEQAVALISRLQENCLHQEAAARVIPVKGKGTALLEAPRGVLLHSYAFDGRGVCTFADIITPTAINQAAMEISLNALVSAMDGAGYDQIRISCERLIRCFDPCISCAVH